MNILYFKYFLLFYLISLLNYDSVSGACSSNLKCMHYGVLNSNCNCECFPSYSGTYCQTANCNQQSTACGTQFTPDMCQTDIVKVYCPQMCQSAVCRCGIDSCLNGGVFNPNTCKCECPFNYSGTVCEVVSKCGTPLSCLNNGVYNNNTCKCDCFPNYIGSVCEILTCAVNEPFDCNTFDKAYCALSIINSYCPFLCGSCSKTTTTTSTTTRITTNTPCLVTQDASSCSFLTSSQCTSSSVIALCPYLCGICKKNSTILTTTLATTLSIPSTTKPTTITTIPTTTQTTATTALTSASTGCSVISCQNSGIYDAFLCRCSCPSGFLGTACELYNCSSILNDPVECSYVDCSWNGAKGVCPNKCICNKVVPITTSTKSCSALTCQNGGVFDASACKCSCPTGFNGVLCENFDCASAVTDPSECSFLDCSLDGVKAYCLKKCGCNTICTALICENNGIFDAKTCKCSCSSGFTGTTCSNYVCNAGNVDPIECSGIDCKITGISDFCPQTCKC